MTTTDHATVGLLAAEPTTDTPVDTSLQAPGRDAGPVTAGRLRTLLIAAAAYLVCSLIVWSHVWWSHPTSVTTCGCGDTSLFLWYLEWPAYAISHGLDPLYSTAMFHPGGVNLLANTSELAIGVALAPVTWLFGPVASLNVALTLSPVLSGLAMFWLLGRWVSWAPAAFVGGLLYGFSPLVLVSLTDAHLMLGMAVVPPLVVACLDEALIRQRRRPVVVGVALGLLVALQFFIGTEVLTIMVITGAIGILLVVLYGARYPDEFRRRVRHATVALGAAGVTAVVLLGYPAWFALAGPAHYSGVVWPGSAIGFGGTALKGYLLPTPASPGFTNLAHQLGGYQGLTLSGQYLGVGLLAVLIGGVIAWRHDRRLWLFGTVAVVSVVLSLGMENHYWVPWRALVWLPLIQNIIPSRFVAMTYLAVAVMLGLIIDHTWEAANRWRTRADPRPTGRPEGSRGGWAGAAAGVVVAGIALVPTATYLAASTPMTTQPVIVPTWFRTVAPRLGGRQVLLVLPAPFSFIESALTWQAVDRMHFSMVGGGGPGGILARAGAEREGQAVIADTSFSFNPRTISTGDIAAVRRALAGWGVTTAVLPDQPGLPAYERVRSVRASATLLTAAIGERPIHQAGAWVWAGVRHAGPPVLLSAAAYAQCAADVSAGGYDSVEGATACVLAAAPGGP